MMDDLRMRGRNNVIVRVETKKLKFDAWLDSADGTDVWVDIGSISYVMFDAEYVRPYLRNLMEDITPEEEEEVKNFTVKNFQESIFRRDRFAIRADAVGHFIKWAIEHHFDIFGLIDKGIAIRVTDECNPYAESEKE